MPPVQSLQSRGSLCPRQAWVHSKKEEEIHYSHCDATHRVGAHTCVWIGRHYSDTEHHSGRLLPWSHTWFWLISGDHRCSLIENKRQMLVASIVFISFGVVAAFCCAIVDGVFAARHIDLRPLYAGRCDYHSSETASDRDVPCQTTTSRSTCNLRVKSNTCYCCDLYHCGREHPLMGLQNKDVLKKFRKSSMIWNRVEVHGGYHEYTDVKSCQDVVHLYHLLWSATILNIVALFLGIITAAVLGGFKDMVRHPSKCDCKCKLCLLRLGFIF
ncbi:hypothetical protein WMY93_009058 [Mugilogobius chulae]|uniref:Transmembrane protein 255A n=1 Tax=Mugilogobius chulae TaxID=88201 RepID=A0AAW0PAP0_9GOBI